MRCRMRGRVRSLVGNLGILALLLAGCSSHVNPPATAAKGGEPERASLEGFEQSERCMIRLNTERDVTEVLSETDGYGLLLPGTQWALRCEDDAPLIGSAGLVRLSVRFGEGGDRSLEDRLRAIHQHFSGSL